MPGFGGFDAADAVDRAQPEKLVAQFDTDKDGKLTGARNDKQPWTHVVVTGMSRYSTKQV